MKFYIDENIVTTSDVEIPSLSEHELDAEQIAFYLANRNATIAEIQAKQLTVHVPSLDELKQAKLNEYLYTLYPFVLNGYEDTETGYTLGTTEDDQFKLTILKSGIIDLPDDRQEKFGLKGSGSATLPVSELKELLKRYYLFCKPVWDAKRDVEDALAEATTPEEVEAITW